MTVMVVRLWIVDVRCRNTGARMLRVFDDMAEAAYFTAEMEAGGFTVAAWEL